jgi:uncharacterized protein (DUF1810 family)
MDNVYNLNRFVEAQNSVYDEVCSELRAGKKTGHWMWFVFPQIKGLGYSPTSKIFAISSLEEARAYLQHPILGRRLVECTEFVNDSSGLTIHDIFGSPDDLKFHSSMTLFAHAGADKEVFETALRKFFGGGYDQATVDRL